ncbi:hypothetical protein BJY52DRAFT_273668 [Lactarius psammicola]|nr:hypothetical protein BJY52DRAFT_273668 [Lactarius psammicola]
MLIVYNLVPILRRSFRLHYLIPLNCVLRCLIGYRLPFLSPHICLLISPLFPFFSFRLISHHFIWSWTSVACVLLIVLRSDIMEIFAVFIVCRASVKNKSIFISFSLSCSQIGFDCAVK